MPYLLDGDNLVGAARRRPGSEADRSALVREISSRLRSTRARVVLYFDGAGSPLTLGSLSVRYAGGISADEAIVREVERSPSPKESTVVTADRDLARRCRDAGGRAISPDEFWSRFAGVTARESGREDEPKIDVADWERWFSEEGDRKP